jgi:hypothetical protein
MNGFLAVLAILVAIAVPVGYAMFVYLQGGISNSPKGEKHV